jgi:hypothetical protein
MQSQAQKKHVFFLLILDKEKPETKNNPRPFCSSDNECEGSELVLRAGEATVAKSHRQSINQSRVSKPNLAYSYV